MCSICDQPDKSQTTKDIECIDYAKSILYGLQHYRLTQKQLCQTLKGLCIKASSDRAHTIAKTPIYGLLKDTKEIVD